LTKDARQREQKHNSTNFVVRTADLGTLNNYLFTVIFARYNDKWLYCRARERDSFETAGGHIEQGETPLDGAKRELFEETGAVRYEITPAFDYSVRANTGYTCGQVYFAQIYELGELPNYEMVEVGLFDVMPDKMRFPEITLVLHEKMQQWLAQQHIKDDKRT